MLLDTSALQHAETVWDFRELRVHIQDLRRNARRQSRGQIDKGEPVAAVLEVEQRVPD
jgi:hypothetical protein